MDITKNYQNCISHNPGVSQFHQPQNEEELRALLKLFREQGTKYSVHSIGNNWGYGAKAPYEGSSDVVNLSKLNGITFFDKESGLVEIEPGVSFKALSDFLIEKGDKWLCPVHGGGPSCSVLGNIMERGFGITPIEDHFESLMSLRVVLPDGEIYESSLSSIGLKDLCRRFHWGLGSYLDGVFTQSNLGIAVKATIRLAPKKESIGVIVLKPKNSTKLTSIIDCIREVQIKHSGIIGGVNLMNKERMISMAVDYPEDAKKKGRPLNLIEVKDLATENDFGEWNILLSVHGSKEVVKHTLKSIKKDFSGISEKCLGLTSKSLKLLKWVSGIFPRVGKIDLKSTVEKLEKFYEILNGVPNNTALNLAYWMNEDKPSGEVLYPDRDNSGLIWYSPILPMDSLLMGEFLARSKKISAKWGVNFLITFTSFNQLSFECTFPILYNKNVEGAAEKAKACYIELLNENYKLGIYPYRFPLFAMNELKQYKDAPAFRLASKFKKVLDPEDLLSPGRYVFL